MEVHASEPDIQLCAKSAIIKIILDGERGSKLNYDRSNIYNQLNPSDLSNTWFLERLYFLDDIQARSIAAKLKVLYPYGSVGKPSWISSGEGVEFGEEMRGRLGESAQRIRTFTEKVDQAEEIQEIRRACEEAERIVFLGFAFHPQNMELLRPKGAPSNVREIYGTCFEMSDQDKRTVESLLEQSFIRSRGGGRQHTPEVKLENLTCHQFFAQYRRTLSR